MSSARVRWKTHSYSYQRLASSCEASCTAACLQIRSTSCICTNHRHRCGWRKRQRSRDLVL